MKQFFLTVTFCVSLLAALSLVLFPVSEAAENPLLVLLNLPAPPPPNPAVQIPARGTLGANAYTKSHPPPDDAPIEVLLEYWQEQSRAYSSLRYKVYPSEKALERILAEIEKEPSTISLFLNILPERDRSIQFVKRMYDQLLKEPGGRDDQHALKQWMKYHTPYFVTELEREASRVVDNGDYVLNHNALLALARVDWDRANPIVSRLYSNPAEPASRATALWALYLHSMKDGSPGDTERYRDELMTIVGNKSLTPGVRDLALDALSMEKEWSGRDDWYLSLLEDETLTDLGRFTGLTTLPATSPEEKFVDRMIALLDSENITVRTAAAQNLIDTRSSNPNVIKALLPWLANPKWLQVTSRASREHLVRALAKVKIPESVPGLIALLDEKGEAGRHPRALGNAAVNTANSAYPEVPPNTARSAWNANVSRGGGEVFYPLRNAAVEALAFQADPRAGPPLRRILNESLESYELMVIVRAVYECGGFTIAEQVAAVEELAATMGEEEQSGAGPADEYRFANTVSNLAVATERYELVAPGAGGRQHVSQAAIISHLGAYLGSLDEVSDELVRAMIARLPAIERTDAKLAAGIRRVLMRWKGTAVNALLLRDLKAGRTDASAIVRLLAVRKEIREKQIQDVHDLRTGGGTAIGISSCLLEDPNDQEAIIEKGSDETRTALLACARLIRAPLPIHKVASHLVSKDKLLALAAERYLEAEDSPEARRIVLSLHPNDAKVMGASTAFFVAEEGIGAVNDYLVPLFATVNPYHAMAGEYQTTLDRDGGDVATEKRLRGEVKKDAELAGIYNWKENFIRVYKDRAMLSWEDDSARYRERRLTDDEFDRFKEMLAHHKVDELRPFLNCVGERCLAKQFLMLGRAGGRRVFVKSLSTPPFFAELDRFFEESRRLPSVIKYWAAQGTPGLEVLFAQEGVDAVAVWSSGRDPLLLTADKARRAQLDAELEAFSEKLEQDGETPISEYLEDPRITQERARREFENYTWNEFSAGSLGPVAAQPPGIEFIPTRDSLPIPATIESWKARSGPVEIRADDRGLYKIEAGRLTKLRTGYYMAPVISPNGRWAVATSYTDQAGPVLVRVNVANGKEFPIAARHRRAIAFVPSVNRILAGPFEGEGEEYDEEGEDARTSVRAGRYLFVDPETGAVTPIRGEVEPLTHQTYRSLQPTGTPNEFWAAIPKGDGTVIGIYSTRTFAMRPLLTLAKIRFDSMDMWVDRAAGKVYFVYQGHLLSAPIKTAAGSG